MSFDIFDTAILRPFFKPTDLFITFDKRISEEYPSEKRSLSKLRKRAEDEVRKKKIYCELSEKEDVLLDDIYAEIAEISNVGDEVLENFKTAECKAESESVHIKTASKIIAKEITARKTISSLS